MHMTCLSNIQYVRTCACVCVYMFVCVCHRAKTNLVEFEHSFERTNLRMQFKKFEFCNK